MTDTRARRLRALAELIRAGTFASHQTTAPDGSATISTTGAQGRYVRIQLTGTNFLSLAEVQVF